MKIKTPLLASVAGLLALILGVWFSSYGKAAEKPVANRSQSVLVQTAPVRIQDVALQLKVLGTVVPHKTVAVSSRIDSQVLKVNFDDGEKVKKGDVLFLLDDRAIRADLNQAKADLGRDQAQVEALRRDYERNLSLIKQDAVSQQALDTSKAALETQIAAVEAAKAAVQSNEVLLDYTVIKSPIDGHTGIVNITEGNNVKANDTNALVIINQTQPIEVQISLPQDSFGQVRAVMATAPLTVSVEQSSTISNPVTGTLSHIDNTIDQGTGTYIARAIFENEGDILWPGMLVNLTLNIGQANKALTVPEVAIQTAPDGKFVFVIENNKARKTPITISRIQNGVAVLTEGVKEGDMVAIDGIMSLKDGATTKDASVSEKIKP